MSVFFRSTEGSSFRVPRCRHKFCLFLARIEVYSFRRPNVGVARPQVRVRAGERENSGSEREKRRLKRLQVLLYGTLERVSGRGPRVGTGIRGKRVCAANPMHCGAR